MKKSISGLVTAVLILFLSANIFAAGVDLTGVGARAMMLGGNYRAVADDWSAMFWNPAGMAFTKGWNAGMGLEFLQPKVGITPHLSLAQQRFSATSDQEIQNEEKTYLMPSGGAFYSDGKLAYGLGFWAPFGLGAKWDLMSTGTYNSEYPKYDWEDDLKVIAVQPTLAYRINDKMSLGLGLSLIYSDIMIRKPNFLPNPYIYNQALAQAAANLPPGAVDSPYDHLLTATELTGDGMSFGATMGLMFKPTEDFSIGASMRYYGTSTLDGTVEATTYFANFPQANAVVAQGLEPTFRQQLQAGLISQEEYFILTKFYSGEVTEQTPETSVEAEMPLPLNFGAGIAYSGIPNLLISADVAWTQWSVWDIIEVNDESGNVITELVENWEDGIRLGAGLEYTLGFARLRGSFYTEPRAAVPETMTPTIPDINRRNVLIVGFGIPIGPMELHASYEKMFIDEFDVSDWELNETRTGYENKAGVYTMDVTNYMVGVDFIF
jgi:long-chain fatty acid transport protein